MTSILWFGSRKSGLALCWRFGKASTNDLDFERPAGRRGTAEFTDTRKRLCRDSSDSSTRGRTAETQTDRSAPRTAAARGPQPVDPAAPLEGQPVTFDHLPRVRAPDDRRDCSVRPDNPANGLEGDARPLVSPRLRVPYRFCKGAV